MQSAHSVAPQSSLSLLDALRQATTEAHRSLEQMPAMKRLLSASLSLEQYAQTLTIFGRFYHQVDRYFAAACMLPADYRYRPRLPWLMQDLKFVISGAQPELNTLSPPWWQTFTRANDTQRNACLLGLAYVAEGSAQGAKIIAPKVAKQLKLNECNGLSFFQQQTESEANWRVLRQYLMSVDASTCSAKSQSQQHIFANQVCQAAAEAFQYLQALCEYERAPAPSVRETKQGARTI